MQNPSQPPRKMSAVHLGVLIRMLGSKESSERDVAVRVLKDLDPEEIALLLRDPVLAPEAIAYFARHAGNRSDWIGALLSNPSLSEEDRSLLIRKDENPSGEGEETDRSAKEEVKDLTLAQRVQNMNVGEKVKNAMKGDKEMRTILIKDTNRDVYMAVLKNPGLKENEVEMLTKNTGTNVEILRAIANNREWVANRVIMNGLVMNPKTPVNISVRLLSRMGRKELEFIAKSKSLPMALRNNARRIVFSKMKRK